MQDQEIIISPSQPVFFILSSKNRLRQKRNDEFINNNPNDINTRLKVFVEYFVEEGERSLLIMDKIIHGRQAIQHEESESIEVLAAGLAFIAHHKILHSKSI